VKAVAVIVCNYLLFRVIWLDSLLILSLKHAHFTFFPQNDGLNFTHKIINL